MAKSQSKIINEILESYLEMIKLEKVKPTLDEVVKLMNYQRSIDEQNRKSDDVLTKERFLELCMEVGLFDEQAPKV